MSRSPDGNRPRDHPESMGRRLYHIMENDNGTIDVFLNPRVMAYDTDIGIREFDVKVRVVRGVVPWPGIEDDIRARYEAWCESGEEIFLGLE